MTNKEILILGKGFIGNRLHQELNCEISDKKIYTYKEAEAEINKFGSRILINCIGHIGINVDECEENKDKTLIANTFVPIILAEVALRKKIKLIHISSGCIYHYDYVKDAPITEEQPPNFFDLFYTRTKIYAEQLLFALSRSQPILIPRIRVPLDSFPHPKNLLTKLIKYKKVIELPNSVTYIPDFISALKHLIDIDARGIYHIVNKGPLEYKDLMNIYKKYTPDYQYEMIEFKKLNIVRTNLILSAKKLEDSGFKISNIYEVLEQCVQDYIKYSSPVVQVL